MLFQKALRRDLVNLAGVVFATLFTIMVTTTLIRWLGRAASGRVDTASVLPLIAFSSISYLPVLLVLTLYVSVLMALTRAYRDSEMVIWFASGQSLLAWVRPVLGFAAPFAVLIAAVSFFVQPWSSRQSLEYLQRFAQREDVSQVSAGQFRESVGANRVFFVESLNEEQTEVRNVFVTQAREDRLTIVVARGGRIETEPDGDRFLVLEKGRRYDGTSDGLELRLAEFERYGLLLAPKAISIDDESTRTKNVLDLLADRSARNLGELHWRISLPISALLVALLAIPLSAVNPRVGRSVNLVVAVLVYVTYNNLLSLTQAWVVQGKLGFGTAVWAVHAALGVLIALLFWKRVTLPWRLSRLFRRRAA